jgi:integrase
MVVRKIDNNTVNEEKTVEQVKVGNYFCEKTKTANIFKISDHRGGFLVRCNYGRVEKISKKSGVKKEVYEITLKVVPTFSEAKQLLNEAEHVREQRKNGCVIENQIMTASKLSLDDAIADFKNNREYTELTKNYQLHYDNYLRHISDFMGGKEPSRIMIEDFDDYYHYQMIRGKLDTAKKNKDGSISKKEVSMTNPEGISVNTLSKHKTALKSLWNFMIRKGCYGVKFNIASVSVIPSVKIAIDGKEMKMNHIPPKQTPLNLEELNYTLNDAIQNEADRSIAVMIALGAIGGLRRSEAVALKVGRYYHDERMQTGEKMWELNDFSGLREYYENHDELILIDEAITSNGGDTLKFPKDNIIRMVGKPKCLSDIIEYAMEQRMQLYSVMGKELGSDERVYMPLVNLIKQKDYSCAKFSRKWTEYQKRRNKRMELAGLKPIPVIRFHDLRHTHATLLGEEIASPKISRNMGHVVPGEGQVSNTTTKVYIHDRKPDRTEIIEYWDSHIKLDWSKAMRVDINAPGNQAHVNGSGHLVIKDEEKKRIMGLRKRFVLTEEEEAELLCSAK